VKPAGTQPLKKMSETGSTKVRTTGLAMLSAGNIACFDRNSSNFCGFLLRLYC
jgi:hypothetical protein